MWIRRLTGFFTVSYRNPWGRLVLLTIYYFAIILVLVLMYGEGQFASTDFIYQGF